MALGVVFRIDASASRPIKAELDGYRRFLEDGPAWQCRTHQPETILLVDLRADHPGVPEFAIATACCVDFKEAARRRLTRLLAEFLDATRTGNR